jgi:hypothetical protein
VTFSWIKLSSKEPGVNQRSLKSGFALHSFAWRLPPHHRNVDYNLNASMLPAGGLREVQNKMKIISRKGLWWFCAALAGLAPLCAGAAPPAHVPAIIQRNYDAARRQYDSNPGDDQAA